MKTTFTVGWCSLSLLSLSLSSLSQTVSINGEIFRIDTLYPKTGTTGFNYPWEVTYGPDDSLWVTEARGYRVWKLHPRDKGVRSVLDISADKDFAEGSGSWPQGGLMGLAIHPDFNTGKRFVYLAYVYHRGSCPSGNPCFFNSKIVRYEYPNTGINRYTLTNPVVIITGLPGSNDHNSGRMTIGPVDRKLYYTIGDMGAGQFNNTSRVMRAQDTLAYEGKVLRFNTEPDAAQSGGAEWIPDDNPFPGNGTAVNRNAVYSYGHRNAQGLVWGHAGGEWRLYSSEHGDKSDDEINIIQKKGNYGWPRVAGLSTDNNYSNTDAYPHNNRLASATLNREDTFYTNNTSRGLSMKEPMKSLFAQPASGIKADGSDIFTWWTIAPSSIDFYSAYIHSIPGWENSLLVSSLKHGLYRLSLSTSGTAFFGDTVRYLAGNRVRDLAISPYGDTLFFAIDRSGSTSGPTGGFAGSDLPTANPGYILRMVYMNALLSKSKTKPAAPSHGNVLKIYPNPAGARLYVDMKKDMSNACPYALFDMTGRQVKQGVAEKAPFTIDIAGLKAGAYVMKIYDSAGNTRAIERIIHY